MYTRPFNRATTGLREQPLNSAGSTPELDAAGATATAVPPAPAGTDSITSVADTTTTPQDLTLFSAMELALDALGGSTQWVVAGAVGIALVTRADVGALVYVVGSLLNAVFSKILKKIINQVLWVCLCLFVFLGGRGASPAPVSCSAYVCATYLVGNCLLSRGGALGVDGDIVPCMLCACGQ